MNLEREMTNATAGRICTDSTLKDFKRTFNQIEKKAKKEGFTNLHIIVTYDEGDDNTLARHYVEIHGSRLETEEEWHKRLEWQKLRNTRDLEQAQRVVSFGRVTMGENESIDKALEKSSLRCEKCGVPETGLVCMGGWKRSKRLCSKCIEAIRNNR